MKVFEKNLYEELRDIEREMKKRLENDLVDDKIKNFVIEELKDVQSTLHKLDCEEFGRCEISGELIPFDLLRTVPTARTMNDFHEIKTFFKKTHSI